MKKVGIITFHHYYNYGTALQAYALQHAISAIDGYNDAELIDFRVSEEKKLSWSQMLLLRLRRIPTYISEWERVMKLKKYSRDLAKKKPAFDRFFQEWFVTSPKTYYSFSELCKDAPEYDVMVTGSDQTWSPKIGFHPAMFLEFGSPKALRIAYAPSIGVSKLSKKDADYINVHLQSFESISCRERLGTEILQKTVKGKKITNVLDPTFLLTGEDWNEIAITPRSKGDYILCYFIGHKTYYRDIAVQLSQDMNLPLVFIPVSWQDMGKGNILESEAGPKEFLGLIRDARLVLTDSFHGTAFCINYRKSFYSFTKIEGGKCASDNSRLYDILSKLHLEGRLYDAPAKIQFTDVDYGEAEKILEQERFNSLQYLREALIDHRICAQSECTGCMACEAACTHGAIKLTKDLMGFKYPHKDMQCCINCGLCEKVCPNNNLPGSNAPITSFVATSVNDQERRTSTSGGLASVMARYVIREGGVAYGCTSRYADHVRHIRIDKEEDVALLKGSKYVQSDMWGIMESVREDLRAGLKVLFVGTPCQVAGLKTLLRKPFDNLYTIDFVCHGVPSQQLLMDIVGYECDILSGKQIDFRFRDKQGQSKYGVRITDDTGKRIYQETYPRSRYIAGFLGGMFYRESCYQCHYAKGKRVSDITLGDYWDREQKYVGMANNGLSMITINTEQGKALFNSVKSDVLMEPIDLGTLQSRNAQLRHPMFHHSDYEPFKLIYTNNGYTRQTVELLDMENKRLQKSIRKTHISSQIKQSVIGKRVIELIKIVMK